MNEEQQKALQEKIKNMSPEELKEFQKQQCIFCQIISGKVPSQKVYEDDKCFAVLDINPASKGHILLLTKEHYSIMPQVPEDEISHLFIVAKYLSQAQLKGFKAQGTTIFVANGLAAGQRAQHFMLHLIPRSENDGLPLDIPQKEAKEADLEKLKGVLIPKINQAFGLKKETVIEKKPSNESEKGLENQEDSQKPEKVEEPEPEPEPEEKEEEKEPEEKPKPKKKPKKKSKPSSKSEKGLEKP